MLAMRQIQNGFFREKSSRVVNGSRLDKNFEYIKFEESMNEPPIDQDSVELSPQQYPKLLQNEEYDDEPEENDDSQDRSDVSSNSGSEEDADNGDQTNDKTPGALNNPIDCEIDANTMVVGDYTDVSQSTQVTNNDHLKFLSSLGSSSITVAELTSGSSFVKKISKRLGSKKKKSRGKSKRNCHDMNQINEANESNDEETNLPLSELVNMSPPRSTSNKK